MHVDNADHGNTEHKKREREKQDCARDDQYPAAKKCSPLLVFRRRAEASLHQLRQRLGEQAITKHTDTHRVVVRGQYADARLRKKVQHQKLIARETTVLDGRDGELSEEMSKLRKS